MPHTPRRYPTTVGPNPETAPPPQEEHPPIPVKREISEEESSPSQRLGLGRISLRNFKGPSPGEIYKQLTGKEPEIDPHTGQLVHRPIVPTQPAGFGEA